MHLLLLGVENVSTRFVHKHTKFLTLLNGCVNTHDRQAWTSGHHAGTSGTMLVSIGVSKKKLQKAPAVVVVGGGGVDGDGGGQVPRGGRDKCQRA